MTPSTSGGGGRAVLAVAHAAAVLSVNGAGDAIAALFFVHYARSRSAAAALSEAGHRSTGFSSRTEEAGSREILTVAAQDEFVSPSRRFPVEEV